VSAWDLRIVDGKRIGVSLYQDHVTRRPTVIVTKHHGGAVTESWCRCELGAPDPRCDVGEALWRMLAKDLLKFDDPRRKQG